MTTKQALIAEYKQQHGEIKTIKNPDDGKTYIIGDFLNWLINDKIDPTYKGLQKALALLEWPDTVKKIKEVAN